MKKRFRSFTAALLALLMVTTTFSVMPLTVSAAEATEDSVGAISGTIGKCTWTVNDYGVLTISGKKTVTNQPDTTAPEDQGGDEEPSTYNESSGQPPIPLPDDPDDDEEPPIFHIPDFSNNSAPWKNYEFTEAVI